MLALRRNHLDATRERHAIPLNSEEGTILLNVILPMAYSKLYRESGPNEMAPLSENNRLLDPVFFFRSVVTSRSSFAIFK